MNKSELTKSIDDYIEKHLYQAEKLGWSHLILRSGSIHDDLNLTNRVPSCCLGMHRAMITSRDKVLQSPPSGKGMSLTIQYNLPRPERAPILSREQFVKRIHVYVTPGKIVRNLKGKSTTTILGFSPHHIKYRRGDSILHLKFDSAYAAYQLIAGRGVFGLTTSALKSLIPKPFSDRYKPFHATVVFQLLMLAQIIHVVGTGTSGDPFRAKIVSKNKI
jgi:hypothetical protein